MEQLCIKLCGFNVGLIVNGPPRRYLFLSDNDDLMKRLNQWTASHKNSNLWSPLSRESKNLIIAILHFIKYCHFE